MMTPPQLDTRCKRAAAPVAGAPEADSGPAPGIDSSPAQQAEWRSAAALSAPRYRADIDGLRAVAVVCVLLFHGNVPGFAGGYIGVDIFFVISGYLITQLLAKSAGAPPRVWLKEFYLRRGRRILPALLVITAVVAAIATVIMLPWDLVEFGKFLAASAVFFGNIAAWTTGTYFNLTNPLTHLWSIAVEEQFYLLYPWVLLFLTRQTPRHRLAAIGVLAAGSFVLCVWASVHKPGANFFLAPTRAWELLLGACVALEATVADLPRITRECLSILAIATLALTVGLYDAHVPYPGVATLAPCLATAILLSTSRQQPTLVGKLLSARPLVFTGLVSYSLYLWHLPILLLLPYYSLEKLRAPELAGLLALSYVAAVITWKYIEQPVRHRALLRSDRRFALTAAAASVALLAVGLAIRAADGLPQRFSRADVPDSWVQTLGACETRPLTEIAAGNLCSYGSEAPGAPRIVVWGDSHAIALTPAYRRLADEYDAHVYFAVMRACRPLLHFQETSLYIAARQHCSDFNVAITQAIARLNPSLVILTAHWQYPDEHLNADFRQGLQRTVQEIGARQLCVVLDVPFYRYDIPHALVNARARGLSADFLQLSRAQVQQDLQMSEADIRALAQKDSFTVVDPKEALCDSRVCQFRADGRVLYADSHHLDTTGAVRVKNTLEPCFTGLRPNGVRP